MSQANGTTTGFDTHGAWNRPYRNAQAAEKVKAPEPSIRLQIEAERQAILAVLPRIKLKSTRLAVQHILRGKTPTAAAKLVGVPRKTLEYRLVEVWSMARAQLDGTLARATNVAPKPHFPFSPKAANSEKPASIDSGR
jgi:hypothetical protein